MLTASEGDSEVRDRTMVEVTRLADFDSGDVTCRGCGREIHLFFNGGELDRKECCGYVYRTEHFRIDLVIERAPNGQPAPNGQAPVVPVGGVPQT